MKAPLGHLERDASNGATYECDGTEPVRSVVAMTTMVRLEDIRSAACARTANAMIERVRGGLGTSPEMSDGHHLNQPVPLHSIRARRRYFETLRTSAAHRTGHATRPCHLADTVVGMPPRQAGRGGGTLA